ncbi:hypothetical protein CLAIMM_01433 isoform 2 [Cladophialophora immunda]|nr:hypothetical protein CLAIMM_01433 isoform 2 [Cladophialophora immunda]
MSSPDRKEPPAHDDELQRPTGLGPNTKRRLHDSSVTFEEYHYYALRTRAREDADHGKQESGGRLSGVLFGREIKSDGARDENNNASFPAEGHASPRAAITADEWANASRALRTASWGAGFYLITTDILGPFGVPFAIGTLGWGPGLALFTAFALVASYSGFLLWKVYLGLDSTEYPLLNYGDIVLRLFGSFARHIVNILQVVQFIAITGQVIIQNGQGISQAARFRICYAVCCVIFTAVGFGVSQIRTLRNYGMISALAVCLNLLTIFMTMGVMAHSPPNFAISVLGSSGSATLPDTIAPDKQGHYPSIRHYGGLPNPNSLVGSINGLMQSVFAFGGAQMFVEIMAEMRRPYDFIKSLCAAQFFIWVVYLTYGCYVYHFQGQYTYQVAYQGVSIYGWQVVGDILVGISGLISAGLYSNIGIKVFYNNVLTDLLGAPPLTTRVGKLIWAVLVPLWWSTARFHARPCDQRLNFS